VLSKPDQDMLGATAYDSTLKNRRENDFDMSTNVHAFKVENFKSVHNRGEFYSFLPKDSKSGICYTHKCFDLQPYSSLNTAIFSSGASSYIDFRLQSIPNALLRDMNLIMSVKNGNTSTAASLYSVPTWFQQIKVLKGGIDSLQTYATSMSNYIETCINFTESRYSSSAYIMAGISPTTFQSVTSIPLSTTSTLMTPVYTSLHNTLVPLQQISKQEVIIRFYINADIRYAATSNVALTDLTLMTANLRLTYIEVDNMEYSTLLANRRLNFKTYQRRFESFITSSLTTASPNRFQLQSTRGTASIIFVWLSQSTPANTNIDTFPQISQVWIENSKQQNIFNQIMFTSAMLNYIAEKEMGGCSFLAGSQNVLMLSPFHPNPRAVWDNEHSSGYLFAGDDIHSLVVLPVATQTNIQVNMLSFCFGMLSLYQDGQFEELGS
jgi:hypothetical protein